ncbi:sugar-phosphatase [Niameybacter sp.]|uniref:sugar-phosphatase n=1 Tax=Niameybacter sp. TaxID=2033640 RepID=UPI002FC7E888
MYKLIALDMDGTLLKDDKTISEATKKAIEQAKDRGVKVVLASGRPIDGIERYLEELDLLSGQDFVISFNGAIVQNTKTKEIVSRITLNGQDLVELYTLAQKLRVNIHAFSKEGCITPMMSKYSLHEGEINGIPVKEVDYNELSPEEEIIKIMMVDEPDVLEKAISQLPQDVYEKYTVVRSAPFFLEFLHKQVNKGTGVESLAHILDIERKDIICMGDAGNDEHMIRYAGLGVAMENAFDEVKEMADFVTKSNEEDGVAYVINKFILGM